jgi:NodT family efflux transporter outer membrane factor (OMF) lipoprotein
MVTQHKYLFKGCALTLATLLLSSCLVGPNYVRPKVVGSPEFKEAKGKMVAGPVKKNWTPIEPQDQMDRGEWWKLFHDPVLDELEYQLNHFNQSIASAQETYHQSLAIVDEARASFFPTVAGVYSMIRERQGGGATSFISSSGGSTSVGTAATGSQVKATTFTNYTAIINASWEPDIWGLVRRTVEADRSLAESNAALIGYTRLSAQGSLAQYYFELRTLDKNQVYLDNTVKSYKRILQLTMNQYKSGTVSRADVVQAQGQLESAQASALNNGILRGQYEHAIAVLIGRPPAYFSLKSMPLVVKAPTIPLTVPSVWLQRRPDIAQSERLLQQYSAQIGIAVAAYFPTLSLTASSTASGNSFHQLIHTPSVGWTAGLQLAETIFDGGLRSATVRAAKDAYLAQLATYRQVVLTAFQDVEDNLISLRILREQDVVQRKAAVSAEWALRLVVNQYKAGTVNYSSVLTSQITAFAAEEAANNVDGLLMSSAVGLIKSLGGGWVVKPTCTKVEIRKFCFAEN